MWFLPLGNRSLVRIMDKVKVKFTKELEGRKITFPFNFFFEIR